MSRTSWTFCWPSLSNKSMIDTQNTNTHWPTDVQVVSREFLWFPSPKSVFLVPIFLVLSLLRIFQVLRLQSVFLLPSRSTAFQVQSLLSVFLLPSLPTAFLVPTLLSVFLEVPPLSWVSLPSAFRCSVVSWTLCLFPAAPYPATWNLCQAVPWREGASLRFLKYFSVNLYFFATDFWDFTRNPWSETQVYLIVFI